LPHPSVTTKTIERNITNGFSEPKKKLLYYLKVMQQAGLDELANVMKISRMAVFPKSYSAIATHALDFIERNMGKGAIEKVLRERQNELFNQYYEHLKGLDFDKRVKELAKIRDEEGYMAESKKITYKSRRGNNSVNATEQRGKHVLLEYNCPIIHIAEKHWEACSVETELFEKLLDAKIETTHRAAKGDLICKFLIKERREGYDYL
jgi:predicted ArsR family transcriptional regulator